MSTLCHRHRVPVAGPSWWARAIAIAGVVVAIAGVGCGDAPIGADAFGNFEATEVRIAAELSGRLLEFPVEEGQQLGAGAAAARVDTAALELERAQVAASRQASASRTTSIDAQLAVLKTQRALAVSELGRAERLAAEAAATPQQLDRARAELAVIDAQMRQVASQRTTVADEVAALAASIARIDDRIARARVDNPIDGTVLMVYAEPEELVATGQPLYDIADLTTLELRAYVSGAQLPELLLGQRVTVAIDGPDGGERLLPGQISWIATTAEFTPSTLQTKAERVDLVYAFKVRVANPDGHLKIGMPGEVYLRPRQGD